MFKGKNWKWNRSLTCSGRVTHICVSKLTIIGSDNEVLPDWRQAIIWTNAGISLITTRTNKLQWFFFKINSFSFKKIRLNSSGKWRPFCLGLNVLISFTGNISCDSLDLEELISTKSLRPVLGFGYLSWKSEALSDLGVISELKNSNDCYYISMT